MGIHKTHILYEDELLTIYYIKMDTTPNLQQNLIVFECLEKN